jgi:hypothetical protein
VKKILACNKPCLEGLPPIEALKQMLSPTYLTDPSTLKTAEAFRAIAKESKLRANSNLLESPLRKSILHQIATILRFYDENIKEGNPAYKDYKKIRKQCLKKIKLGKNLTYKWFHAFVMSVLMSVTDKKSRKQESEVGAFTDVKALIKHWKDVNKLCEKIDQMPTLRCLGKFPDQVILPSTACDLEIDEITDLCLSGQNGLGDASAYPKLWLLGLTDKKIVADGREMEPIHFLFHDFSHLSNLKFVIETVDSKAETIALIKGTLEEFRRESLSEEDKKILEFMLFLSLHESYAFGIDLLMFRGVDTSRLEKLKDKLNDPWWYYNIVPTKNAQTGVVDSQELDKWVGVYADFINKITSSSHLRFNHSQELASH